MIPAKYCDCKEVEMMSETAEKKPKRRTHANIEINITFLIPNL